MSEQRIVYVAGDCPTKAAELAAVVRHASPALADELLGGVLPIRVSTLARPGHVYVVDPVDDPPIAIDPYRP